MLLPATKNAAGYWEESHLATSMTDARHASKWKGSEHIYSPDFISNNFLQLTGLCRQLLENISK